MSFESFLGTLDGWVDSNGNELDGNIRGAIVPLRWRFTLSLIKFPSPTKRSVWEKVAD